MWQIEEHGRVDKQLSGAVCIEVLKRYDKWKDVARLSGPQDLRAINVVFHSPVVHTPQVGKAITTQYLSAAFHVFFNESFQYIREIAGSHDAALEFQVEIDGITGNGVDLLK